MNQNQQPAAQLPLIVDKALADSTRNVSRNERQPSNYQLHLRSRKPISQTGRRLTAGEVTFISNLKFSVVPRGKNWWLRLPTAIESDRHKLPVDVVCLENIDYLGERAIWHVAIDNPEMIAGVRAASAPAAESLPT